MRAPTGSLVNSFGFPMSLSAVVRPDFDDLAI